MKTFRCIGFSIEDVRPTSATLTMAPVKADTPHAAARLFADRAALRLFGAEGVSTSLDETYERGVYRAFIGLMKGTRTTGTSVRLTIAEASR